MNNAARSMKVQSLLLAVTIGFAMLGVMLAFVMTASPAQAKESRAEVARSLYQPPPPDDSDLQFIAFFTEEVPIEITDLSGSVIGEGVHGGEVRCNGNNCAQNTGLSIAGISPDYPAFQFEYKFRTRQAIDPEARFVVVGGSGILQIDRQKERFSFTATFEDNRDGTVRVTYVSSRSDASFIIPRAPGTFQISSRR